MSGGYEDDVDKLEEMIYTGQGGNNMKGNQRQYRDQRMEKSNLALKVSDLHVYGN
jgi:euchromatic histone-lysine N-methyltransferase